MFDISSLTGLEIERLEEAAGISFMDLADTMGEDEVPPMRVMWAIAWVSSARDGDIRPFDKFYAETTMPQAMSIFTGDDSDPKGSAPVTPEPAKTRTSRSRSTSAPAK